MISRRDTLLGGAAAVAAGMGVAVGQDYAAPGVYVEEVPSGLRLAVGALETAQTVMVTSHLASRDPVLIRRPAEARNVAKPSGERELLQNVEAFFANGGRALHLFPAEDGTANGLLGHELTHVGVRGLARSGRLIGGAWTGAQRPIPIGMILVPEAANLADAEPDSAAEVYRELARTAETLKAFALIDTPARIDGQDFAAGNAVIEARAWRARLSIDSSHAALYGHQLVSGSTLMPVSPSLAGLIARTDGRRGVWKAPAGLDATLRFGAAQAYTDADAGILNPEGINTLRQVGSGQNVVWGSRTLAPQGAEVLYIPVRRTLDHVSQSVRWSLQSVVFEPNDEPLWDASRRAIDNFLARLWRQGALQGTRADQAFFVRCGLGETMSQNDIDNGRMICHVGLAPLRPAEFIIEKIVFEGFAS